MDTDTIIRQRLEGFRIMLNWRCLHHQAWTDSKRCEQAAALWDYFADVLSYTSLLHLQLAAQIERGDLILYDPDGEYDYLTSTFCCIDPDDKLVMRPFGLSLLLVASVAGLVA